MNKIKTKIRQLKYKFTHDFLAIENVVLALAIILGSIWTFQSIQAMSRNWELNEKLSTEKLELERIRIEVETAELENEYYRTDEYQELSARKHLDKQLPGEKMVVLPENSEEAKNKHQETKTTSEPKQYSNFEKWLRFLFP